MCKSRADGGQRCAGHLAADLARAQERLAAAQERLAEIARTGQESPGETERLCARKAALASRAARLSDELAAARPRLPPGHDLGPEQMLSLPTVWHVGTMNPADKKDWSYEGRGLSVSLHPDDWERIARLPGRTWRLDRPAGLFLNAHAMTAEQRQAVTDWAVAEGLVEVRIVWAAAHYDSEDDVERESLHHTYEQALAEADDDDDGEPVPPQERSRMVATAELSRRDPTVRDGDIDPDGAVLGLYAQHGPHRTDFDGVYWDDVYDPDALSCPRGVIAPEKLARWSRRQA